MLPDFNCNTINARGIYQILRQEIVKRLLFSTVLGSLMGMSVSCTHLSDLTVIFKRDNGPLRGRHPSPMLPIALEESGVAIDVFVIRVPYDRHELLERFWNDAEESEIPITIRNDLYKNGLRQGMLPSKIPVSFERLLELKDVPPQKPFERVIKTGSAATEEPLHKCLTVKMMRKQPVEFPICEEMIPKLPVLAVVDGKPTGKDYPGACGKIWISTDEQPDGSVLIKTIPEIHYGGETGRITSEAGEYTRKVYKSKLQFDQLAVETKLLLGQWVVIGPETRQNTGFGRNIFRQNEGSPEQILIGIRLRQTSKDGIHDRNDIAVLRISDDQSHERQMVMDNRELKHEYHFPEGLSDQEQKKTTEN